MFLMFFLLLMFLDVFLPYQRSLMFLIYVC